MAEAIIKFVLMGIGIIFTYILIPYIKSRIDAKKYDYLVEFVKYAVRSAEQLFTKEENKEKKKYVYDYILNKTNDIGLNLTEKDLNVLIEGIVNLVKHDRDYISE